MFDDQEIKFCLFLKDSWQAEKIKLAGLETG